MTTWLDRVAGSGRIRVEPMDWLAVEYLCFHAREIDKREIYGNIPTTNPLEWAAMLYHAANKMGMAWVAYFNGRPAAIIGLSENWPGCWQVFSWGTENYRRVLVAFRPKFEEMIEYGRKNGMHRLEAKSLEDHTEAHKFLRLMQFTPEATLEKYGRNGENYILFKRVWDVRQ